MPPWRRHGNSRNPEFDYKKVFVQDPVTSLFLDRCAKRTIVFRVYGSDPDARKLQAEAAAQVTQVHASPGLGLDTSAGSTTVGSMAGPLTEAVSSLAAVAESAVSMAGQVRRHIRLRKSRVRTHVRPDHRCI